MTDNETGFTIDDRHLKGNIFSDLNVSTEQGKKLPANTTGYQQSKAEVQRQIKTMRRRLHPEKPQV